MTEPSTRKTDCTIDLQNEAPIPLSEVPKLKWILASRMGRRIHCSTVHRWCNRGIRGKRLEYIQVGGRKVTTEEALMRFFRSLMEKGEEGKQEHGRVDRKEIARVEKELDDAGL